jgi:uncharacterized protein
MHAVFASRWLGQPAAQETSDDRVSIVAGPRTDWFLPPGGGEARLNAPALVGPVAGDFVLAAAVEVAFAATFDAGALVLWHDERTWAKLCFEYSPDAEPMVVSVVTRGTSDDCNSVVVEGNRVHLRVARIGSAYAFHYSEDGGRWHFVRQFRLDGDVLAGFEAQSPLGEGCRATFTSVALESRTLGDLRGGE